MLHCSGIVCESMLRGGGLLVSPFSLVYEGDFDRAFRLILSVVDSYSHRSR